MAATLDFYTVRDVLTYPTPGWGFPGTVPYPLPVDSHLNTINWGLTTNNRNASEQYTINVGLNYWNPSTGKWVNAYKTSGVVTQATAVNTTGISKPTSTDTVIPKGTLMRLLFEIVPVGSTSTILSSVAMSFITSYVIWGDSTVLAEGAFI